MSNIIKFKPRSRPTRQQAAQWLAINYPKFPDMPENIGPNLFYGWRFIRGIDGVVYFANCIEPGITEAELQQFIANT